MGSFTGGAEEREGNAVEAVREDEEEGVDPAEVQQIR